MNTESRGLHVHSQSSFFETSRFVRWMIICLSGLGVLLFFQNKNFYLPQLEVGMIAKEVIRAPIPFSAVDEASTESSFAAHMREAGPLYMLSKGDVVKRQQEIEMDLVQKPFWKDLSPSVRYEEMIQGVFSLGSLLSQVRFSFPKAMKEYRELFGSTGPYFPLGTTNPTKGVCFTDPMLDQIQEILVKRYQMKPQIAQYLVDTLKEKIWFLSEESLKKTEWEQLKKDSFPVQYTHFPAGFIVILPGEKVSTSHMLRMEGLRKALAQAQYDSRFVRFWGNLLLTSVIIGVFILFFTNYFSKIADSNLTCLLISSVVLLFLLWAKIYEVVLMHLPQTTFENIHFSILVPGVGILLCILVNPFVALFASVMTTIIMSFGLVFKAHNFMILNLIVSFVCIFYTKTLRRRAEIVVVCFRGLLVTAFLTLALCLLEPERGLGCWVRDLSISGIFMLVTSIVVIGLLPIFESLFHVLTDINLMEYMNSNNPLLKRLMQEAPGTYQHSLLLGSLSEAAATAIGCDGLFCRVATLYHDIGKICIAHYFSENQDVGMNIHQLLTPAESAKVIVSHVQEGVNLARREGLPEPFLDIIKEHHGTSLVYYFYHKQLQASDNDPTKVRERDFRYLGPKPHSKEAAIVMIADSFEAACRSLEEITEASLSKLIDQIVREKMDDGQFDECTMSFEELSKVKKALVKCILSIGHFRIKYPEKKAKQLSSMA